MSPDQNPANEIFASALRIALTDAFGRMPSASKFANAFNLRAHGTSTITRETARKWLRGDALPKIGSMRVLINWLGIDPSAFLTTSAAGGENTENYYREIETTSATDVRHALQVILNELDNASLEPLYLTALAMRELRKKEKRIGTLAPSQLNFVIS